MEILTFDNVRPSSMTLDDLLSGRFVMVGIETEPQAHVDVSFLDEGTHHE